MIGCTALTAKEAVELGRHAISIGADGIGSTPPPYSKTYPDETVRYYEDISDGVDAPLMAYNWPHGTSVDIGPDLAERLAAVGNVVAIKDSTPEPGAVLRDDEARGRGRARVRPVHERRRPRVPARERRRRLHRRRLAVGRARRRVLGGHLAGRPRRSRASTHAEPTSSSPSSGCPAAGAASSAPTRASSRR